MRHCWMTLMDNTSLQNSNEIKYSGWATCFWGNLDDVSRQQAINHEPCSKVTDKQIEDESTVVTRTPAIFDTVNITKQLVAPQW